VGKLATGMVFTGEQALALKLVDKLGGYEDAIEYAAGDAGIKGEPLLQNMQKDKKFPFNFDTSTYVKPQGTLMDEKRLPALVEQMLLAPQLAQ
jgi:protease IV